MNDSLNTQVGGSHYKNLVVQPVELFAVSKWDYFQSSIARYVTRYKNKNGIDDLEKSIHVCDMAIDLQVSSPVAPKALIDVYVRLNNMSYNASQVLYLINHSNYGVAKIYLQNLLDDYKSK